jgi:hypothetical protein
MMLTGWMGVFFALERGEANLNPISISLPLPVRGRGQPFCGCWEGVEINRRWIILAGLAWGVMGVIVPFYIGLLGVLISAWLIVLWIVRRAIPWREFAACALTAAIPVGLLIYNAWLFSTNPVFAGWAAQNDLPSPPLIDYLLAYGLLLILGMIGLLTLRKDRLNDKHRLLIVWIAAAAVLVYVPLNVQRRLLEGVIVPLSILATLGVFRLVGEKPGEDDPKLGWRLRQVAMGVVIMLILPSTLLVVGGGALTAARVEEPVFHSAAELDALTAASCWLRRSRATSSPPTPGCGRISGRGRRRTTIIERTGSPLLFCSVEWPTRIAANSLTRSASITSGLAH